MPELKVKLRIEGMNCEHCAATVQKALQSVKGVRSVRVDLKGREATVEQEQSGDPNALVSAVNAKGYKASFAGS